MIFAAKPGRLDHERTLAQAKIQVHTNGATAAAEHQPLKSRHPCAAANTTRRRHTGCQPAAHTPVHMHKRAQGPRQASRPPDAPKQLLAKFAAGLTFSPLQPVHSSVYSEAVPPNSCDCRPHTATVCARPAMSQSHERECAKPSLSGQPDAPSGRMPSPLPHPPHLPAQSGSPHARRHARLWPAHLATTQPRGRPRSADRESLISVSQAV